ncbi:uncharacterized protein LOC144093791 [Amblyomma americanum]
MASVEEAAVDMPAGMPMKELESAAPFDICTAANFGCVSLVRELLSVGRNGASRPVDVNAQNRGGWTPLMYAASSGRRETVQLLLEHGANVNQRNGRGRTPAILAAMYGHHHCIALLYEYGADLEARDSEDRTALFHAALFGHTEVVQVLVDLGVNINCVEQFSGHSPKSIAAENHHDSLVEILLNAGSRFAQITTNGNTLHPVCQTNIPKTSPCGRQRTPEVESLVRHCANLALEGTSPRPNRCLNLPPKSAVRNLADFLGHLGLSKYVPMLESQGIDLEQLLTFGDAQLEQAGIRLIGPKRKMAVAISNWNERERQLAQGDGRSTNLPL